MATGGLVHSVAAHRENITQLAMSSNGILLATASSDDRCRLWSRMSRKCVLTIEQENKYDQICVAFRPDSKYVVVGDSENSLKLYRVASGKLLLTFTGHTETVSAVVFSPDGKRVISCSWDDTIRIPDRGGLTIRLPPEYGRAGILRLRFDVSLQRSLPEIPSPRLRDEVGGRELAYVPISNSPEQPRPLISPVQLADMSAEA